MLLSSQMKEIVSNKGEKVQPQVFLVVVDYKKSLWSVDVKSDEYKMLKSKCHLRSAIRLRELCCENGGVFIKVGQHLGALDYLLPEEYVETMKVLHTDAPKSAVEDVYKVIEEDLGKPIHDIFDSFDDKPLGAASLAQVHKAQLKDGRVVAVKVQHRGVQAHADVDAATIGFLVDVVSWLFPEFRFEWLVEEMKKNLPLELDFVHEGKNCERLGRLLKDFPYLKVPKIHWDISTKRVLSMEFCEGGKVNDVQYIKKEGLSSEEVSKKLGQLYSEMIFVHGYIHCDPHPGNILVKRSVKGDTEIILLDHGLYQTLSDDFRITYCKMWQSLIGADVNGIKKYSAKLGVGNMYGLLACILSARSWDAVTSGMEKVSVTQKEVEEVQNYAVRYMTEITDVLNRIPRQMILILKTNDLLRGIDSRLKTAATSRSFVTMSKCCIRAVKEHDLKQCDNWTCLCKVHFQAVVDYTRIALYQFSLTRLGDRLLMVWGVVSNNFRYVYSLLTGRQNNNMALALA